MTPGPALAALLGSVLLACGPPADPDSDGDGLSDFREVHKHGTDPARADSDGDGTPDGDWDERREYAYTIRTVVRIMPPVSEHALTDDYQDARIRGRGDDWIELEVVHYPFNTVADPIVADPGWRDRNPWLDAYVRPGPTTNWDEAMRRDMIGGLAAEGIDVEAMTDLAIAGRVPAWLLDRVENLNSSAYGILFRDGEPELLPGTEVSFRRIMWNPEGTIDEQLQHELYGRGMYFRKTTGSCTSAANYLTTGLRALGLPTRMVRAIPFADASDPAQLELVRQGIDDDEEVRRTLLAALRRLGSSFAAHTYNEVYVGGRWRRLNYDRLGQNTYDPGSMGLMTHVQVYNDLAEAGLADTWGRWNAGSRREPPFRYSNPYTALEVSDQPAVHSAKKRAPATGSP